MNNTMLKDWQLLKLHEVSSIVDSLHRTPEFSQTGYSMVRAADVKGGFLDLHGTELVSYEEFLAFTRNHKPQKGDIVLSRVGSYFNFCYNKDEDEFCIGQNTSIIIPTIDGRFLYYSLISPYVQEQIEQALVGTSQKTLSLKHIRELKIPIPSPNQRKAIARILGVLDDKIELNCRLNCALMDLARAIYIEWFINQSNPELTEIKTIVSEISKRNSRNEIITVFSAVKAGKLVPSDELFNKQVYSRDLSKYKIIKQNNFAYNPARVNIGSIGMLEEKQGLISPVYIAFSVKPGYEWFMLFFLRLTQTKAVIGQLCSGSVRQNLSFRDFASIRIPIPSNSRLQKFNELWGSFRKIIFHNEEESQLLANLRDELLPKLMSGKVRVTDVEKEL